MCANNLFFFYLEQLELLFFRDLFPFPSLANFMIPEKTSPFHKGETAVESIDFGLLPKGEKSKNRNWFSAIMVR
jgi:hypothetical protein